jgi:hypothetical protein
MVCPCCYACTCDTSWLPREGNLTSITYSVKRLNCAPYEISLTLPIPEASPNQQQLIGDRKVQQTSNVCVSGPRGTTGLGAALISIRFRRCPLNLFATFADYYQMLVRLGGQDIVPYAPCDYSGFEGQGVDDSLAYVLFGGFNIGSSLAQSTFFETESGTKWSNISGPWCASIKTAEDTLTIARSLLIPASNVSDPCVRTPRPPAVTINYESELKLSFSMLP